MKSDKPSLGIDPPAPRFAFLDGVRGLAALYVVLHHAWFDVFWTGGQHEWPAALTRSTHWLSYGQHAVTIFIVLSGFCLALPVARNPDRVLAGGLIAFARRRAIRILPAYYAAIAVCVSLLVLVPVLRQQTESRWDHALPGLTSDAILSHLLLIHNLSQRWIYQFDPPMWSIATEWQIYFVFALLLAPAYRMLGIVATVCIGFTFGSVIQVLWPALEPACPWFVGLFAIGMAAAHVAVAPDEYAVRLRLWRGWRPLSLSLISIYVVNVLGLQCLQTIDIPNDAFVGTVAAVAIVNLAAGSQPARRQLSRRLLESAPAQWLGRCSYSVYLMHCPLLAIAHLVMRQAGVTPAWRLASMILVVVPAVILACYGFHCIFERPWLKPAGLVPAGVRLRFLRQPLATSP